MNRYPIICEASFLWKPTVIRAARWSARRGPCLEILLSRGISSVSAAIYQTIPGSHSTITRHFNQRYSILLTSSSTVWILVSVFLVCAGPGLSFVENGAASAALHIAFSTDDFTPGTVVGRGRAARHWDEAIPANTWDIIN